MEPNAAGATWSSGDSEKPITTRRSFCFALISFDFGRTLRPGECTPPFFTRYAATDRMDIDDREFLPATELAT